MQILTRTMYFDIDIINQTKLDNDLNPLINLKYYILDLTKFSFVY